MPKTAPLLELKNLSFSVGKKPILHDLNLIINPYELVVITGKNGSGKSTLASLIMGLDRPISGQILFDGEDITSAKIEDRAQKGLSLAFQTPIAFRGVKIKDLLTAPGQSSSKSAQTALSQVGLTPKDYLDREFNNSLSGGEKKRLEIATVLAKPNTKLYIFDEPEAGIDLWSFGNFLTLFQNIHKTNKKRQNPCSILLISHNKQLFNIATRILTLKNGQLTPAILNVTSGK